MRSCIRAFIMAHYLLAVCSPKVDLLSGVARPTEVLLSPSLAAFENANRDCPLQRNIWRRVECASVDVQLPGRDRPETRRRPPAGANPILTHPGSEASQHRVPDRPS